MKPYFLIVLIIITVNSFAQNDSIKERNIYIKAYTIDSLSQKPKKTSTIKFDSINVKVEYFKDKAETKNYFLNSKTNLSISFYFEKNKLSLVRIAERCKSMKDLSNTTEYYFDEQNKIFNERHYHKGRICLSIPIGKSIYETYGYNKSLNDNFLKSFITELLSEIKKNYR